MSISIERDLSIYSTWSCFGGLMMQDYQYGRDHFQREGGSFIPQADGTWQSDLINYNPSDIVRKQIDTLDRLLRTYVMPNQEFVFKRLLDCVIILQGWSEHAKWNGIECLKTSDPRTVFAPATDKMVRDALLEFYAAFLPEFFVGKGKTQPEEIGTKEWLTDCERQLQEMIKSGTPTRNKILNEIIRPSSSKLNPSLFKVSKLIVQEIVTRYLSLHKYKNPKGQGQEKYSWATGKQWGNEYNWACYLVNPEWTGNDTTVNQEGWRRLEGMQQMVENIDAKTGAELCRLLGMTGFFPHDFQLKSVHEIRGEWLETTGSTKLSIKRSVDNWYSIWKSKISKSNFHFDNFAIDGRNQRSVAHYIEEFAVMEKRFEPVANGKIPAEKEPTLGKRPDVQHKELEGQFPTRKGVDVRIRGMIPDEKKFEFAPILAAGAVVGGMFYLFS